MRASPPENAKDPLLSVVVVIASDTTERRVDLSMLRECLDALARQVNAPALEIIVAFPALAQESQARAFDDLKTEFRQVHFMLVRDLKTYAVAERSREHHDELRARGLAAARGDVIALLEDHEYPDPHWSRQVVAAHSGEVAGVGGAIENGVNRLLNWAVYFCDFGKYQNPVPIGPSAFISDVNSAYKRSALMPIRDIWQDAFREPEVNAVLQRRDEKLVLFPTVVVYQNRRNLRLGTALAERVIWGRSYAVLRGRHTPKGKRWLLALLSPLLPGLLLARMSLNAWQRRRHFIPFLKAFPLTVLLTICWSIGELSGYLASLSASAIGAAGEHEHTTRLSVPLK